MKAKNKKSLFIIVGFFVALLLTSLTLFISYSIKGGTTRDKAIVTLDDNNNDFKTSKAPGPMVQDLLAKPFDMSFRELIRRAEYSVSGKSASNIFNYFTVDEFNSIYSEDNLGITSLKISLIDSGMFRNIVGSGSMLINGKKYDCTERVDLVNSDVLVLNCEAKNG